MKEKASRTFWNCTCEICAHQWQTKNESVPTVCSKCSSRNWDKSSHAKEAPKENPLLEVSNFGRLKTSSQIVESREAKEIGVKEIEYDMNPQDFDL